MDAKKIADLLEFILATDTCPEERQAMVEEINASRLRSFREAGVLTMDEGVTFYVGREQFHITVA